MPPHHHHHHHHNEKYVDEYWWEELPSNVMNAAKILGYTADLWNSSDYTNVQCNQTDFSKWTPEQKRAAVYIGRPPLEYKLKNVMWADLDSTSQTYAQILGWNETKWNNGWTIRDVDCYQWWWQDATEEQKKALQHFGYTENLWNQQGQEEPFGATSSTSTATSSSEEKKDDDDDKKKKNQKQSSKPAATGSSTSHASSSASTQPKVKFSVSPLYGGDSGNSFDHGNNFHIDEITVFADANMVHGILVEYKGKTAKVGSVPTNTSTGKTLKLRPGEFITSAKVRASKKQVHAISFLSNRGTSLIAGTSTKGEETIVKAPCPGAVLVGLTGKAGKHVNSIGFRWGPSPVRNNTTTTTTTN